MSAPSRSTVRPVLRGAAGLLLVGALMGPLSACESPRPVRVGAKAFTEQRILAHTLRTLVERELERPAHVVECEDTFACHRLLRGGAIDVMVEYTGTAVLYSGRSFVVEEPVAPPPTSTAPGVDGGPANAPEAPVRLVPRQEALGLKALSEAYAPDGIVWLAPLGFDNGYRVVVAARQAREQGLASIGDLSRAGPLVFTVPPSYVQRPGDGLGPLLRRHGLRLDGRPLLKADSFTRVELLERGQADVAVLYATDPALSTRALTVLEDKDGFFPRYDAAVIATSGALERVEGLKALLESLEGENDTASMRHLNAEVDLEGWTPRDVGARLAGELRPLKAADVDDKDPILVAAPDTGELEAYEARTTRAVREVFGGRPVKIVRTARPLRALTQGRARLALVGAEQLFRKTRRGRLVRQRAVEANAVVGVRALHQLGAGAPSRVEDLDGARASASALGFEGLTVAPRAQVLADGGLTMATVGGPALDAAVQKHGLTSVSPRRTLDEAPWLRPLRIPGGTYPGQDLPIDTVGSQVVLVGPARSSGSSSGGPVAAVRATSLPLTVGEVRALSRATGMLEAPDPALPGPWSASEGMRQPDEVTLLDRLLTALALLYIAWLLKLLFQRDDDDAT